MSLNIGLLILRLVIGLTMAGHGAQKVFGWWGGPGMTGWTQAMTRLRIRPAVPFAWLAALAELGYEFNLTLMAGAVAIGLAGPGTYSIDQAIGLRMPEPITFLVGVVAVILGVAGMLAFRSPKSAVQPKPQTT